MTQTWNISNVQSNENAITSENILVGTYLSWPAFNQVGLFLKKSCIAVNRSVTSLNLGKAEVPIPFLILGRASLCALLNTSIHLVLPPSFSLSTTFILWNKRLLFSNFFTWFICLKQSSTLLHFWIISLKFQRQRKK